MTQAKAIPGKQAVRELLGVKRDSSYILERLHFIFHYIQRSRMIFCFYINRIKIHIRQGTLIPAKPPEVRENATAKPHHTRICRSRCENRPDSQRDYDSKGSAGLRVPLRVVEIDLILKGIKNDRYH